MIRLKNLSKFYHSKGIIASGISRVNLEFEIGEFVVITGESGSGKSTLLNVISGLDSYEEGEMYINGQETSHYMAADFEEYRRKYIGNIFQDYNLINSYTVYQNVELILRINGYSRKEMKKRVDEIIERVGLTKFRRTKASKLSGGQKQRVAIARALARNTDIILADEPTGNLDSKSSEEIAELLSEIAKEKLVIIVTHNYDQFADFATRRIKMHDGKVTEDISIAAKQSESVVPSSESTRTSKEKTGVKGHISIGSEIRLGFRNTFNIAYKFLLLVVVFLFLVTAIAAQYTSFLNQQAEVDALGWNSWFYNYSNDRIVMKKTDGSVFTQQDLEKIRDTENIERIVENDMVLDSSIFVEDSDFTFEAFIHSIDEFKGKVDKGTMPEADDEVLLTGQEDEYGFNKEQMDKVIGKKLTVYMGDYSEYKIKVTGISIDRNVDEYQYAGDVYLSEALLSDVRAGTYKNYSKLTTVINGKAQEYADGEGVYNILLSDKVAEGTAILSDEANMFYQNGVAKGRTITVRVENIYYSDSLDLRIADVYTEKNFTKKTGAKDYDIDGGAVFISKADYDKFFNRGNYQVSAYVKDVRYTDEAVKALKKEGFAPMALKDAKFSMDDDIRSIIQVPLMIIISIAALFIAYIVIGLILRSRNSYFSILRMLGMEKKNLRRILDIEMFIIAGIAFLLFATVGILTNYGVITLEYIVKLVEYMQLRDYIILYLLIEIMALVISGRFANKLFRKTAMGSFRGE